jgi:hypothetical protein
MITRYTFISLGDGWWGVESGDEKMMRDERSKDFCGLMY